MCLAIPGKVINIEKNSITVNYPTGNREAVNTGLRLKKDDFVLVQAGLVIQKIPKKEALESLDAWKEVSEKLR